MNKARFAKEIRWLAKRAARHARTWMKKSVTRRNRRAGKRDPEAKPVAVLDCWRI